MKELRPAKKRVEVSVGESVRILRELQELSQSQLSKLTGTCAKLELEISLRTISHAPQIPHPSE